MRAMFTDPELQKQFESDGFVRLPLLSPAQCAQLQELYASRNAGNEQGFYTSIWSEDQAYREEVDRELQAVLLPEVNKVLADCRPVFSNFMVKRAQANSEIGLHQDWTFTDESRFAAVNCWIPLVDTRPGNGPLRIVKRSHRFPPCIRGRNIRSPYDPIQAKIRAQYMTELEVPAGTAVIFDERLLHDSEDNLSGQDRVAVSLVMVPQEAELIHYLRHGEDDFVGQLNVLPAFFTSHGLFDDLSVFLPARTEPYQFEGYTLDEFARLYTELNRPVRSGFLQKLGRIFSSG